MQTNRHYAVVGLGASGLSAVNYLTQLGHKVSVTDGDYPVLADKLPKTVACYFGGLDETLLTTVDAIVISPGVNPAHAPIVAAKHAGIEVVSDVQLFLEECHRQNIPIIAITGSNAKSTVTTLVGQMVLDAGIACGVGGNLGTPALDLLKDPIQMAVLELSSFQLEHITDLQACAATILNLSPDHLDRHGTMDAYLKAKLAILDKVQTPCLGVDDEALYQACLGELDEHQKAQQITISGMPSERMMYDFGVVKQAGRLYLYHQNKLLVAADELLIKGVHNLSNALFALALGSAAGLLMPAMIDSLKRFTGLPHRCQFVKKVHGCDYFNDSKGTNVGATVAAMIGLGEVYGEQSLVLILGGQAKGQAFSELRQLIERYGYAVLTIGVDADKIANDLAGISTPLLACEHLDKAVQVAYQLSCKDKAVRAVLLSPACASFDQFSGFVERGEVFEQLVQALPTASNGS